MTSNAAVLVPPLTLPTRTKFFMHSDYQLAYCPITQIISFAFRDGAFFYTDLTPELIWRLRVPKRSSSLPLRWKPEVLNMPLLRRFERTTCGYELHASLPMTYESSRRTLKELGRDARFKTILDITTFAVGPRMKSIVSYSRAQSLKMLSPCLRKCLLTRSGQGTSLARSGKGCLVSRVTRYLKSTTSHSSLDAISNMLFFFDRLRKVYCASLAVCSGRETH